MAIKITGTTVINDSREFENINDINLVINKPVITSPTDGSTTDSGLAPEIVGTVYTPLFDIDTRDYREFQIDFLSGDFTTPERSNQVNADSWVVDPLLDSDTDYKVRIRDVSVNGTVSEWSDEITFTTANIFVDQPTVTVEGSPDAVPSNPVISTSAFSVTGDTDTHQSTDWQVIRTSDSSVVFESLNDTTNLTSITVSTDLDRQDQFEFRAQHRGDTFGVSGYASTIATTDAFVDQPTVSVEDGPSDVPENPTISTSAFSVTNGSDTHQSTDWEVIRTSDSVTVFSSTGDTSNLTSITVTTSLDESTEYEFRARHNGITFGSSTFGSVTATTLASFGPTTLGESFEGGFYMGTIAAAGTTYYLVVAPNATGCASCQWKTSFTSTSGTCSLDDGYANTYPALENSTHPAGNWTATRTIDGFSDWYLPAIDELQVFYNNGGGNGSGDPLPSGEDFSIVDFYWSSTECGSCNACILYFCTGGRYNTGKATTHCLRAVRRVTI